MNTAELATQMGVTEAEFSGWVSGVSYWMSRGATFEQAIAKHEAVLLLLLNKAHGDTAWAKAAVVDQYDALRA